MTDGGAPRPRRAIGPDEDVADDTPTVVLYTPRRGGGVPSGDESVPDAPESEPLKRTWQAVEPVAEPQPDEPVTPVPPPAAGRRVSSATLPSDATYRPRRSASSALSPTDAPEPLPAATPGKAATAGKGDKPRRTDRPTGDAPARDRFGTFFLAVASFAALLLVGGMIASAVWPRAAVPALSPTANPSFSGSVAPVTASDLLTPADLAPVAQTAWYIGQTLTEVKAASPQAACLTAITGSVRADLTLQRTLASSDHKDIAALHQIDHFGSAEDTMRVFNERRARLAACDDEPTLIVSSTSVTGLGDDAVQLTVAYQAAETEYHTVLMVRSGSLISTYDMTRVGEPLAVDGVVAAAKAALTRSCATNGSCPTDPKASSSVPPASTPAGWLQVSALPRVTPGNGRWTATDPGALKSAGTSCENATLATVTGPTDRGQRTLLLTQDAKAPTGFGADELRFTFADATQAAAFSKSVGDAIASCADRVLTATISDAGTIDATVGSAKVAGRTFTVAQATGQDKSVVFQVALSQTGNYVTYVVVNTTASFKLTPAQMSAIGVRSAARATQAS